MSETHEEHQSLWLLTFGPMIWGAHFLASYATAAIWCSRYAHDASLGPVPRVVFLLALPSLIGIAVIGWIGWKRHRHGGEAPPHDEDTPEDRHRFLGFATLLLAALSAVATLYVASAAAFFGTCR